MEETLAIFSFIIQHTSTTNTQVCVKNYNSDANNKDVITVDYMITGGRKSGTFNLYTVKNDLSFENEMLTSKVKLNSSFVMKG